MKASSSLLTLGLVVGSTLASGTFLPAQAIQSFYGATLGPEALNATGTGSVQLTYDNVANTLRIIVNFSGLTGTTTAAHIHGPTTVAGTGTAGVMTTTPTFASFPTGVTSDSYVNTLDLTSSSSFRAGFITASGGVEGARNTFISSLNAGTAYFNIHTTFLPGGEIRGFLTPTPVPLESDAFPVVVSGLFVAGGVWFKRKRSQAKASEFLSNTNSNESA